MSMPLTGVHPDVRVWLVDLDADDQLSRSAASILSADEVARAARFVFERHRNRFIAGRAALRRILATEVNRAPETLSFDYSPTGKPELTPDIDRHLWFNVSHSDRFALIAATRVGALGIDIEKRRPLPDVLRLAQTAFSDNELAELRQMPAESREEAFFAGWTRKEAYIKARGDNLGALGDFDVSLSPGEPARLKRAAGGAAETTRWTLASFGSVEGYASALCVEQATSSSRPPSAGRT